MSDQPLISIIIPTYNSGEYLQECFDSVLNQTYSNIEVIIVDGGSIDSTIDIIKKNIAHKNWRLFMCKKGVSRQRNLGLDNCTGEYIYFLDSDDYISESLIEDLYHILTNNDLDVVTSEIITAHYVDKKLIKLNKIDPKIRKDISPDNFFIDGYDSFLAGPTKLYRRELIGPHRFDESLSFGEDYLFNYELSCDKSFKFGICLSARYYYRKTSEESSFSKRMNKGTVRFFPKFLRILKKIKIGSDNYKFAFKLLKDNANQIIMDYVSSKKTIPFALLSTRLYFFMNDHSNKKWFYLFPKMFR